jgi:hypothetical protein
MVIASCALFLFRGGEYPNGYMAECYFFASARTNKRHLNQHSSSSSMAWEAAACRGGFGGGGGGGGMAPLPNWRDKVRRSA